MGAQVHDAGGQAKEGPGVNWNGGTYYLPTYTTSTTSSWTTDTMAYYPTVTRSDPVAPPPPLSALDRLDASVSEMCKVGREVMA